VAAPPDPALVDRLREQYLSRLLAHIEAHKFYPRAARRRRLEGVIQVSFTLDDSGHVRRVTVNGGHNVLQKAAEEAVRKAQPLPKPPKEVPCPLQVSYGMEFNLK
jgi:protein TonB